MVKWYFWKHCNQELSFAGPYPAAVGCQGQVFKNAVKCVSAELLNSDLPMLYPYFACDLELLISNKNIWLLTSTHLNNELAVFIWQYVKCRIKIV